MGKKKQPIYKIVAADARSPRDGKFIEAIGLYNPKTDPATINIKDDRVLYWLKSGAQPTDTVKSILSNQGILLKIDLMSEGLSEDQINLKLDEWKKLKEANLAAKVSKKAKKAAEKKSESATEA